MIRIQFNDTNSRCEADFEIITEEVVQLTGDNIPNNTSGFKAYRKSGKFLGDYSDYKEIVAEVENGFHFKKGGA